MFRKKVDVNTTSFGRDARDSDTTALFHRIRAFPGWFNVDDVAHFTLVLRLQEQLGVRGDIFEIGSYHGRSTAVLAALLGPGEVLYVCDAFEREVHESYADQPSPERLLANVAAANDGLDLDQIVVLEGYSHEIELPDTELRFCHIDGGHETSAIEADLARCADRTVAGAVIAVDDYEHPRFPAVRPAVDAFVAARPEFERLADLNRHGARGRKIYLVRRLGPQSSTS